MNVFPATCAHAGGVMLYEVGTPDMFTAGAGWAARAEDAATVFTNPAGMARLKGGDLLIGTGALYGDIRFTPNANTTVSGGDGGVAANSSFGLASGYDDGWLGRYYVEKSTLIGLSVLPSVAYRVSPELSFGGSLDAVYGILKDDVAINSVLPAEADGQLSLSAADPGFGGNFGALWEPSEKARVGVTYTSPVQLDFVERPEFTDLGPAMEAALQAAGLLDEDLGIGITVPQTVMASFYCELGTEWALLGDVGWQDWSRFGGAEIAVATDPPGELTVQLPYKDTWRGALGAKRRLGGAWRLSAGVGYDSPMVDDSDRTITLPVGPAWRLAAGAQRTLSERFELGFGYTYAYSGSLPADQERGTLAGRVAGAFDNAAIHFFGLNGHWKF